MLYLPIQGAAWRSMAAVAETLGTVAHKTGVDNSTTSTTSVLSTTLNDSNNNRLDYINMAPTSYPWRCTYPGCYHPYVDRSSVFRHYREGHPVAAAGRTSDHSWVTANSTGGQNAGRGVGPPVGRQVVAPAVTTVVGGAATSVGGVSNAVAFLVPPSLPFLPSLPPLPLLSLPPLLPPPPLLPALPPPPSVRPWSRPQDVVGSAPRLLASHPICPPSHCSSSSCGLVLNLSFKPLTSVQLRSSRSTRNQDHNTAPRNRAGVLDLDPTEGLPVRKWEQVSVVVNQDATPDPTDANNQSTENEESEFPWPEQPLPSWFPQLAPHSQVSRIIALALSEP